MAAVHVDFPKEHLLAFRWLDKPFDQLGAQHVSDPEARRLLGALTGYISDGSEVLSCADGAAFRR